MSESAIFSAHGFHDSKSSPTHLSLEVFNQFVEASSPLSYSFEPLKKQDFISSQSSLHYQSQTKRYITFDDGLESVMRAAEIMPWKGTVFIVTGNAGGTNHWPGQPKWVVRESCLNWSQIRDLQAQGWTIGAHSHTHPDFTQISPQQIKTEIETSQKVIEDQTGHSCDFFAYPYGSAPAIARDIVFQSGMIGLGTEPGWIDHSSVRQEYLPRIEIYDLIYSRIARRFLYRPPSNHELCWLRLRRIGGHYLRKLRQLR